MRIERGKREETKKEDRGRGEGEEREKGERERGRWGMRGEKKGCDRR